jgi:putative hydrolase of the HAD superfamily
MIKTVIFDVGGVLVRTEDYRGRRSWEERLGLSEGGAEQIVFNSEMGLRAQRGAITDAELWVWVGHHLMLSEGKLDSFREAFWSGDVLDQAMVKLIRRLRPRYQTAIISNATDALNSRLKVEYAIADAFDLIVGSAEEKVMKPNPIIFERTLTRLARRPSETVFIDDFKVNVLAAQDLGMHVIHFIPGTDLASELANLGVEVR